MLINPEKFDVPKDESNLAVRAAELFLKNTPHENISITLTKKIPSGAGLGGGSSNAAAILLGLQSIFPEIKKNIFSLGAMLGSDVSFFLQPSPRALITGTGEKIGPLTKQDSKYIILVKLKNISISTAWAYRKWDESKKISHSQNDFESLIFSEYFEIEEITKIFKNLGAKEAGLCGSGATVYGIFSEQEKIPFVLEKYNNRYWKWTGKTL